MLRKAWAVPAIAVCLVATVDAQPAAAPHAGPTYQHHAGYSRPFYPGYHVPPARSFSFQRPYPYHLDYYRKRYQGGYEPYFGNLYGPPAVVGTQPFAFGGYPAAPQTGSPAPPYATPYVQCPHCEQAVPLPGTAPLPAAPAATNESR